jgi:hypothetical protein
MATVRRNLGAVLVGVLVLFGAGCSSDTADSPEATSEDATEAAVEATDDTEAGAESGADADTSDATTDAAAAGGADCPALLEGRAAFVSSVNLFTVLDDPDVIDEALGEGGLAAMEDYIVLLRPHQDVEAEGGLGSLREGLDNLEADIAATRDGRIDERVGGYSATAVSAVLAAIGC